MNPDTAASMTEFMGEAERLHVPVIDGVAAAIKFAEAIVGMRLRTAKAGDWRIRSPDCTWTSSPPMRRQRCFQPRSARAPPV